MFVEVETARARNTVDRSAAVLTEIDLVEVRLENLALRITKRDPYGDRHLSQLPRERALRRQVDVLHELLGQGAAAFDHASFARVFDGRARDPDRVDAGMKRETAILGHEHGVLE